MKGDRKPITKSSNIKPQSMPFTLSTSKGNAVVCFIKPEMLGIECREHIEPLFLNVCFVAIIRKTFPLFFSVADVFICLNRFIKGSSA